MAKEAMKQLEFTISYVVDADACKITEIIEMLKASGGHAEVSNVKVRAAESK